MLFQPSPTYAQWTPGVCTYTHEGDQVATIGGLECLMQIALQYIVGFVAIGVLVMLVIGGYKLLTSGGDPKGVEGGKNVITYAIMGLVIALLSVFIINFIAQFTGATGILQFNLSS